MNPGDALDALWQLVGLLRDIHGALDLQQRLREAAMQSSPLFDHTLPRLIFATADLRTGGAFTGGDQPWRPFYQGARAVADTGLVAVGIWSGYRIMWAHGVRHQHSLRTLLPRLVLAVFLVNFSLLLIQFAIDLSNTVSGVVAAAGPAFVVNDLVAALISGKDNTALAFLTLLALFTGYLVLAVGYVMRFALLVILAILSPLAALCFVLPETHHYAREWGSLFISSLLMQPLQLLILTVGFQLDATVVVDSPLRHLFALSALLIAFKVPGALHSVSSSGTKAANYANRQANHLAHLAAAAARAA